LPSSVTVRRPGSIARPSNTRALIKFNMALLDPSAPRPFERLASLLSYAHRRDL
jgi:hypothetical protein